LLDSLVEPDPREEAAVAALLACLAWADMELDEAREAERLVVEAVTRLRADNYRLGLADALRVQGLVAVKQRRWLEAARSGGGPRPRAAYRLPYGGGSPPAYLRLPA